MKSSGKIALLALINIIWGFIPWPATYLFGHYSIFLVVFTRFLIMSIFLLVLVFLSIIFQKKNRLVNGSRRSVKFIDLFNYLKSQNYEFKKIPQWIYLLIVAIFGLNGMVVLFFWGLKVVGAIITATGFIIALILTSMINWGIGKEEMTNFKILYLSTLFVAMIIIGLGGNPNSSSDSSNFIDNLSWGALFLMVLYGAAQSFFLLTSASDRLTPNEYKLLREAPNYKSIRIFFKLAILSLFSAISLIPILMIIRVFPLTSSSKSEIELFFIQFQNWWKIAVSPHGLILIFVCTILPYVFYYKLADSWSKNSSFDVWAGVLQIIEPIVNIIIGLFVLQENFPSDWLIIVIFLMGVAIFMRYLSETDAQINAILLLKINPKNAYAAMEKSYALKHVKQVHKLIGQYDLMCNVQLSSQKDLFRFIHKEIVRIPGVRAYELEIITGNELDETIPEEHKGETIKKRLKNSIN